MRKSIKIFSAAIMLTAMMIAACNGPQRHDENKYLSQGKTIATETFNALSSELKAALARGGVPEAISYCNIQAMPITDSLSKLYNADIKRTSLNIRNPMNAPDSLELAILNEYQRKFENGDSLHPQILPVGENKVLFTAPIMVKPLCLNCHGEIGKQIQDTSYAIIRKHYPEDQATGYKAGDLRGMWSIRFNTEDE
ncbi:MAG: DUF3365 domain-containing protein [Bacteroidales bacterium]|nr:DUF3365 domain-containing protein [Bacteroidales bacterium]MCF8343932.1 DUF3365 domain-containing protein [Bacteroidales bacterium]MCF8349935.1 DUF3365 domain-containing protein [Bacteroidales bacterium]MCF8375452.1 DUF3365 domain-containing protein [Bacteroidales bacterium]MCF8401344.1 DUF3365 domain-containing protein [Bacteroidales bacterium]